MWQIKSFVLEREGELQRKPARVLTLRLPGSGSERAQAAELLKTDIGTPEMHGPWYFQGMRKAPRFIASPTLIPAAMGDVMCAGIFDSFNRLDGSRFASIQDIPAQMGSQV
jgi:hypothetical protein